MCGLIFTRKVYLITSIPLTTLNMLFFFVKGHIIIVDYIDIVVTDAMASLMFEIHAVAWCNTELFYNI